MKIARVFPTKTSMTPEDSDAYYGLPLGLIMPKYDQIHISVTFTWDLDKAERLASEWGRYGKVKIGGPALGDPGGEFTPGTYVKHGVTITSRGCPNKCWFCFVPKREGDQRELSEIKEGNIVLDNNLTACTWTHLEKVFRMLMKQKQVSFNAGLEAARIDQTFVDRLRALPSLKELWLAYDRADAEEPLVRAVGRLKNHFPRNKIRCYVLIGYKGDTIEKAESRLIRAWDIGTKPFAMLYKDECNTEQSKEWKLFQRKWTRPAIFCSLMKNR